VLDAVPDPALVLLGPPGSGKSTLLRHYELECCQHGLAEPRDDGLLTFFIPLNDYKPVKDELPPPMEWLSGRWQAVDAGLPPLVDLLKARRMTLLLDAINEIPFARDEAIRTWREFLMHLADDYPGNRVIFSCRSLDYSGLLSTPDLPVPQVRIEALSPEQVEEFLTRYDRPTLWPNLRGTPQFELFRLPYYLKLLVELSPDGTIPAGRAALFTGLVRQSLKREVERDNPQFRAGELVTERDIRRLAQARQWKTPWELPDAGLLLGKLAELAYAMQDQRSGQEAGLVRIDSDEALVLLKHPRAQDLLDAGAALGVLDQDPGSDEVLYVHQLLQEYFAARRLAEAPDNTRLSRPWRTEEVQPSLSETLAKLADSDPLPPLPTTGWEETTMMAAAMAESPQDFVNALKSHNLVLAGRCAAQPDVSLPEPQKQALRWALVERSRDEEADLRERIAAGMTLGDLSDPRFQRRNGPHGDYLLPPLIEISGGTYTLGREDGEHWERPVHTVELSAFRIGQFAVTNAEWALFMAAGGYDDERWWDTSEALAWQRGESTTEGPKQQLRETRTWVQKNYEQLHTFPGWTSQQVEDWRGWADMTDQAFDELLDSNYPPGRKTEPSYWQDSSYNAAAQPVVGICWYEAQAYCAWLSAQTGDRYRLPTEAQWEAAARGQDGRAYAYGYPFDPARCNTFETHVRRTTPIGIFAGGDTPEGVSDLCGNTWDWTSSLYRDYPYRADDGREEPLSGDGRRVVRGGSWVYDQCIARAAFRNGYHPDFRGYDLGLRVVSCSPIA
jgi:formylglycine-generating enzyme required for sulfatase activity